MKQVFSLSQVSHRGEISPPPKKESRVLKGSAAAFEYFAFLACIPVMLSDDKHPNGTEYSSNPQNLAEIPTVKKIQMCFLCSSEDRPKK